MPIAKLTRYLIIFFCFFYSSNLFALEWTVTPGETHTRLVEFRCEPVTSSATTNNPNDFISSNAIILHPNSSLKGMGECNSMISFEYPEPEIVINNLILEIKSASGSGSCLFVPGEHTGTCVVEHIPVWGIFVIKHDFTVDPWAFNKLYIELEVYEIGQGVTPDEILLTPQPKASLGIALPIKVSVPIGEYYTSLDILARNNGPSGNSNVEISSNLPDSVSIYKFDSKCKVVLSDPHVLKCGPYGINPSGNKDILLGIAAKPNAKPERMEINVSGKSDYADPIENSFILQVIPDGAYLASCPIGLINYDGGILTANCGEGFLKSYVTLDYEHNCKPGAKVSYQPQSGGHGYLSCSAGSVF